MSVEKPLINARSWWESDTQEASGSLPSILVVDDDAHFIDLQLRMLRSMGYARLTSANGAREALLQIEHDPDAADVTICDLNMPGMDGLEFLRLLNASPYRGSVILLSGASQRVMHSIQKLLGQGPLRVLGALSKPASRAALQQSLQAWRLKEFAQPVVVRPRLSDDEVAKALRAQQLVLAYQPQVSLRGGELVALEALVRCQHPERGLLYPDQFLPAAERLGLIDAVTDWVVTTAARQLRAWRVQGLAVGMAVNISQENLNAPDFWSRMTAMVQRCGVASSQFTFELTEGRVAAPSEAALENLIRLQLQGFSLAIDDFGTGQSSLSQLRDIPFTQLKIDRGFVRGALHDPIIRPILEGSLAIARRMRLSSVAEGVETPSDWEALCELECDVAQGFLIGRPMYAEQLVTWLPVWHEIRDLILPAAS